MPESGKYEKLPRPETIKKFLEYLSGVKVVSNITQQSDQIVRVHRQLKTDINVYMTNIYIVSIADVVEITAEAECSLNAIVTMSAWNGYTSEAKDYCKDQEIGLFKFREFLGAVYYEDNRFLDYVPPSEHRRG